MIGFNYKGPLIFYGYAEEVEKQKKNGKVKETVQQFGGPMTQERYAKEILPVVRRRKEECKAVGLKFVFQEDNDGSHGTRSFENPARYAKDEMELNFIVVRVLSS